MSAKHYEPRLNKKRVLSHADYAVYSVNGLAVRNVAKPDEEFGNFATQDEFKHLIPKGEIWISEKLCPKEGVFFIANALARCSQKADGASDPYDDGLQAEQVLREKVNSIKYRDGKPHRHVPRQIYLERYLIIPDPQGPVEVWLVDGNLVRSYYKTDYTEGGHGYVYNWVPRNQIWVEDGLDRRELPFIVSHEFLERRLMRDAHIEYDKAHEICSRVEFDLRKEKGATPLLVSGRKKLQRSDLPKLARDEVYDFVQKKYVRNGQKS
jgi:hypothetical protein